MASTGNPAIVVGVDGSDRALHAVRWAALSAARHRAPLRLVHAAAFPDLFVGAAVPPPPGVKDLLRARGWKLLREARRLAESVATVDLHTEVVPDLPAPYFVEASKSARMLVLGASGRGQFTGLLAGSITVNLAAHAHCPVVAVRGEGWEEARGDRPVVVGIDGSPASEPAIEYAFAEASARDVGLVAVHAWGDGDFASVFAEAELYFEWEPLGDSERRLLAERLAGWSEKYPDVPVERVVVRDRPRHELLTRSKSAQLVVVGSRGRGGFGGLLLGSTSQALLHRADCPVMIARPNIDGGNQ
ncbi:universal stress protein [Amycolatopsis anabasis]|uniref:universal stress protein n=1 Tax=Amycolatopsis anabasis TaxID=1840409 RepID=UPI00131D29E0|nr:universal stress protein [Amycolatopsis anabasis]